MTTETDDIVSLIRQLKVSAKKQYLINPDEDIKNIIDKKIALLEILEKSILTKYPMVENESKRN